MTTATLPIFSAASVRERAHGLLTALLTVLALLPYALGWLVGAVVEVCAIKRVLGRNVTRTVREVGSA